MLTLVICELSNTLSQEDTPGLADAWKTQLFPALATLQTTQISCFTQADSPSDPLKLRDRNVYYPPYYTDESSSAGDIQPYNSCKHLPRDFEGTAWRGESRVVQGVTCLTAAVLLQSWVDIDQAEKTHVEHFFQQAAKLRAYSYLRLCLLPALQSSVAGSEDSQPLYADVLYRLLSSVLKIMTGLHMYKVRESDGYPFFPSSSPAPGECLQDTLHDLLLLLHDFLLYRPDFGAVFFQDNTGYHSFLRFLAHTHRNNSLLHIPTMNFLAALAGGTVSNESPYTSNVFDFFNTVRLHASPHSSGGVASTGPSSAWNMLFNDVIVKVGVKLGAFMYSNPGTALGTDRTQAPGGAGPRGLDPDYDEEYLASAYELLIGVTQSIVSATAFMHEIDKPVQKIFALLSCRFSYTLKGLLFQVLSGLARVDMETARDIWNLLESERVLPCKTFSFHGMKQHMKKGLREELEDAESKAGKYPITVGFLGLIQSLLAQHPALPVDALGSAYRVPGVLLYIEYIIDDILLKAHVRPYAPSGPTGTAQQWRITSQALDILSTVLRHYMVHTVRIDDWEETVHKKNKKNNTDQKNSE